MESSQLLPPVAKCHSLQQNLGTKLVTHLHRGVRCLNVTTVQATAASVFLWGILVDVSSYDCAIDLMELCPLDAYIVCQNRNEKPWSIHFCGVLQPKLPLTSWSSSSPQHLLSYNWTWAKNSLWRWTPQILKWVLFSHSNILVRCMRVPFSPIVWLQQRKNYDRELLALKLALGEWKHWLVGSEHIFIV